MVVSGVVEANGFLFQKTYTVDPDNGKLFLIEEKQNLMDWRLI